VIADARGLRPALPILIGTAVMLSLSLGIRQSFGLFLQPITKDLALSVSDFTIAVSIQNLTWGICSRSLARWWCATVLGRSYSAARCFILPASPRSPPRKA
jgi:hypothetical protein